MKKLLILAIAALAACSSEPEKLSYSEEEASYETKTEHGWDLEFTPDLENNEDRHLTLRGFRSVQDCRNAAAMMAAFYNIEWSAYKDANREYICLYNLQSSGLYEYKMR